MTVKFHEKNKSSAQGNLKQPNYRLNILEKVLMGISEKRTRKKRRWGKIFEYSIYERALLVGDEYKELLKELEEDFLKRKALVVTPQEIAAKRDIRVSVAKQLLEDLEEKTILKKVFSNRRLKVYTKA
jgi:ribosomal protein S25